MNAEKDQQIKHMEEMAQKKPHPNVATYRNSRFLLLGISISLFFIAYNYITFRKIMRSSSNETIRRPHRIQTASAYSISPPRPLTAQRKAVS